MTHADDIKTVGDRRDSAVGADTTGNVTVHECSPERTVFTEKGNSDGWIATDTTVELGR